MSPCPHPCLEALRNSRAGRCAALSLAAWLCVTATGCGVESATDTTSPAAATAPPQHQAPGGIATSLGGRYLVEFRPADEGVSLGTMHDWVLRLRRRDGTPAQPDTVTFDGGMPAHGHGFTTAPRITRELDDGVYLVQGVRFHMAGDWQLHATVTDTEGADRAVIRIAVTP